MRCLLAIFVLSSFLVLNTTAQTQLNLSASMGPKGGAIGAPYENPLLWGGLFFEVEVERFLAPTRSLSFYARHGGYRKRELSDTEISSSALYLGVAYNLSARKPEFKHLFFELSPTAALGLEKISWEGTGLDGRDHLKYLMLGARFSVGLNSQFGIFKFSLMPAYDALIADDRQILLNTSDIEDPRLIENPDYKSEVYLQAKISLGLTF